MEKTAYPLFSGILKPILREVEGGLLSPACGKLLLHMADFPVPEFPGPVILEVPLTEERKSMDLACCLERPPGETGFKHLGSDFRRRLLPLFRLRQLECFWLEWDIPEEAGSPGEPLLFFQAKANEPHGRQGETLLSQLELFRERSLLPAQKELYCSLLARLPQSGWLKHLGCLAPRQKEEIRLCFHGTPVPWLEELFPGRERDWELLQRLSLLFDKKGMVHLTLGETLSSVVGVELYLEEKGLYRTHNRWLEILKELEITGLCLPSKREGLKNWNRSHREIFYPEGYVCRWYIDYLKVVFVPGQAPRVKLYLMVKFLKSY